MSSTKQKWSGTSESNRVVSPAQTERIPVFLVPENKKAEPGFPGSA
jgi:hypothetical protein